MDWLAALLRWCHFLAGVMWIGLLYFFNFVNAPAAAQATAAGEAGPISKYITPLALVYFRWAAVATWIVGAGLLATNPYGPLPNGLNGFFAAFSVQGQYALIGIGAWLGTIMLFNVWALIWPNQKKLLGFVAATDPEKAKARRVAFLASRTNTMLSIPMLFFMGSSHFSQLFVR